MRLDPDQLSARCDPARLSFGDTRELAQLADAPGQQQAIESIRFAVGVPHGGFNLFVLGAPDTGKLEASTGLLRQIAQAARTPGDWCYLNNFEDPARPLCIELPAGRGPRLRDQLAQFIDELRTAIPAVFESEEYHARVAKIDSGFAALQEKTFGDLIAEARESGVALWRTPTGFSFAPARDGEVMPPEEFDKLADADKARVGEAIEMLQERLERLLRQVVAWRRARRQALKALNQEVTMLAVGSLVDDLIREFLPWPAVVAHLVALQTDVVNNAELFQQSGESAGAEIAALQAEALHPLRRYQVNLLVARTPGEGAPVVIEDNPTFPNLIGRVEYLARFGALVTDFAMIKPGALHRAAGGYLLLDARRVLMQAFAWETLKRVLVTREIRIESIGQLYGLVSTVTLEPQPVPFNAKVVMFGDRSLYMLLQALDPDFAELFKIAPEFGDDMPRTTDSVDAYARWIATIVAQAGLRPFDPSAVARVVDWSSRQAEDTGKLSLAVRRIRDLLIESEQWALRQAREVVSAADVTQALAARRARSDELRRRMHERITEQTVLIDTRGAKVGQVNGLAVISLGELSFGLPTRITATTRLGDGTVIDIQREAQLGGAFHTKGVMILSSYLASRFSARQPLSLAASLVFEQTYAEVDGDSASLAELCALLSSLSGLALRQGFAVTGSVNQRGEVQAIGGVNEKVEGFFDICRAREPDASRLRASPLGSPDGRREAPKAPETGLQGVLIPASNRRHLMLRDEVVEAVRAGHFSVIAVSTVDEAMAWLSSDESTRSLDRDDLGRLIDEKVRARLSEFARLRQRFGGMAPERRSRRH